MSILRCGITKSWKLISLLAFPLFWLGVFLSESGLMRDQELLNIFSLLYILFSGKCLSGLFELVSIFIQKKRLHHKEFTQNNIITETSKITYIQSPEIEKQKFQKKNFVWFSIVAILEISQLYWSKTISSKSLSDYLEKRYQLKGFQIIPTALLYKYLISKHHFYFHHKVSLVIISFSLLFIAINSLCFSNKEYSSWISSTLQYFGIFMIYSIQSIVEKWIVDKKSVSPYIFLFFQGIIGLILTTIFQLTIYDPMISTIANMEDFHDGFVRLANSSLLIFYFIANILMICGYSIFILLGNRDYSPVHISICETFYSFLFVLYSLIFLDGKNSEKQICYFICFVFIFVFALIYNEIIIIHWYKFDIDTHHGITERGIQEDIHLMINNEDLL